MKTTEDSKQYWNARPCNSGHSPAEEGSLQYSLEVSQRRYFVEPHIPGFAAFPLWQGKSVLEVGCGIGSDGLMFARAGAEYYGVDLSEKSLEIARKRFASEGLEGELLQGDAESDLMSGYMNDSFDLIYSFGVIHHMENPQAALIEIRKRMNFNSEFRFMVYAENSWKSLMIESGVEHYEAQAGVPIVREYSEASVTELVNEAGFEVVSVKRDFIFPYQVDDYKRGKYVVQPWFQTMPPDVVAAMARRFGQHLLVTCKAFERKTSGR